MIFVLQEFIDSPSLDKIEMCRKDDLLCIAAHYDINVQKYGVKKDIKDKVIEKLIELNILVPVDLTVTDPHGESAGDSSCELGENVCVNSDAKVEENTVTTPQRATTERVDPPATMPRLEPFSPDARPLGAGTGASSSAKIKLRLARLQLEAEEKEKVRKADYDLKLQVRKLEIQAEKEVKLRQLDIEAMRLSAKRDTVQKSEHYTHSESPKHGFDVSKNIALVPTFRETEVDAYFSAFERIATALAWPREMWPILLQCKLVGKAQEVLSSLPLDESLNYDVLKESILRAYELVPEAYRQKFRTHKKATGQTFVEFAREKGLLFDKWCTANNVKSQFESLRQLILLEDFKNALPEKMVLFFNEQKVTTLSKAAVLADEFVLTHKNVFVSSRTDRAVCPAGFGPDKMPLERSKSSRSPPREERECFYCHKKGHVIADCLSLRCKQTQPNTTQSKGVGLINNIICPATELLHSKCSELDPCFKPFVSQGFVSVTGAPEDQYPVTILRDTGGSQSIIRAGILTLSDETSCHTSAIVQGVGMSFIPAPLHTVYVQSALVQGFFKVAVLPALPIKGVDFILGNDLAGGKVSPVLEVVESPESNTEPDNTDVFPNCVVTRAQAKKYGVDLSDSFLVTEEYSEMEPKSTPSTADLDAAKLPATRKEFITAQKGDITLSKCFSSVVNQGKAKGSKVAYILDDGMLMRRWTDEIMDNEGEHVTYQVIVPTVFRAQVLSLAHDHPWSGHMGVAKTYNRVLRHFFWPGLKSDVVKHCRTCHVCQMTGKPNQVIPPAPLCPIPVMGEPFEKVIVDCVGPLPKTKTGNQFLLTIMCASTRYPEAIPLRKITSPVITKALVKFFSTFGLPKTIQTDQGTNFKSNVFAHALNTLGITHVTSSPYHPESQGALERFHQTMKSVLRKHCFESQKDWDDSVPLVLFAAREAVQESLGFSPAQLVFGHEVRGPLKILKEQLLTPAKTVKSIPEYVARLRERLALACSLAKESLASSQEKMKQRFDKKALIHLFQPGDKVLVLLPVPGSSLSTKFSGPYVVERKLSDTNYVIHTPDRRRRSRVCHVNMLKLYHTRGDDQPEPPSTSDVKSTAPVASFTKVGTTEPDDGLVMRNATPQGARLSNSEILSNLSNYLSHFAGDQRDDITRLILDYPTLFNDIPSQTSVISHDIVLINPSPIKQRAYRVNPAKREVMRKEVEYLMQNAFAVPSSSPWSSPCLLDTKSDGSPRFCTDFRKVNSVTVPDAHPLPLIDDCIDEIGPATYVSKLDMLKGYWQVPLTKRASDISAFVTPDHFLQYTVMPFGLCNAPATFQRLVNKVLGGIPNCRAYLDDIVVYTKDWASHLTILREVFKRLSAASLTLNLAKCEFGQGTVQYLGQQVGGGKVCPMEAKIITISTFPPPTTRRELRRFLGMAGYYRRFCKNFSSVAAPLTALTSPAKHFVWSDECQTSFESLKSLLCCAPVLSAPDFQRPFKLEVDASAVGAGAVLLQEDEKGIDHPVSFFSRKFDKHQLKYSTIEKETLALLFAVQHFEVYLGSSVKPITVFTDHNPLTFLSRMYNNNQRLMRWSLILQNYNLEIKHKKGSENIVADTLSRIK